MNLKPFHKTICIKILKAETRGEVHHHIGHAVGQYIVMQCGRNKALETEVVVFKMCADKRRAQLVVK